VTKRGQAEILSGREIEVLRWIKQGKTNIEISELLGISERTIKFHVQSIMKKLRCQNRVHAVSIAIEQGLIDKG
jgi:DNA-binding CsgD family transcriptional regulator